MRAIIVDDEPIMIRSFMRLSSSIGYLEVVGQFQSPFEALEYSERENFDLALLDIQMPGMTGLDLARRLKERKPDLLVVFITAYDDYLRDSIDLQADYYILKPYTQETIMMMMDKMRLLARRQEKGLYIRTFGRFNVIKDGKPVAISGKAKEILAFLVSKRGKEASNEEIYSTIWEGRRYSNVDMKVYYNALRRLRMALEDAGIGELLVSSSHGKMVNTQMFSCDYYNWLDRNLGVDEHFEGEFMSEYSWAEYILADMMEGDY